MNGQQPPRPGPRQQALEPEDEPPKEARREQGEDPLVAQPCQRLVAGKGLPDGVRAGHRAAARRDDAGGRGGQEVGPGAAGVLGPAEGLEEGFSGEHVRPGPGGHCR